MLGAASLEGLRAVGVEVVGSDGGGAEVWGLGGGGEGVSGLEGGGVMRWPPLIRTYLGPSLCNSRAACNKPSSTCG